MAVDDLNLANLLPCEDEIGVHTIANKVRVVMIRVGSDRLNLL